MQKSQLVILSLSLSLSLRTRERDARSPYGRRLQSHIARCNDLFLSSSLKKDLSSGMSDSIEASISNDVTRGKEGERKFRMSHPRRWISNIFLICKINSSRCGNPSILGKCCGFSCPLLHSVIKGHFYSVESTGSRKSPMVKYFPRWISWKWTRDENIV